MSYREIERRLAALEQRIQAIDQADQAAADLSAALAGDEAAHARLLRSSSNYRTFVRNLELVYGDMPHTEEE